MSLYQHIAESYDDLFPLNKACIEALEALVPVSETRRGKSALALGNTGSRGTAGEATARQNRPRRVLDLGSATGALIAALEDRGWEALGIELDPDMAAKSRGKVAQGSMLEAETIIRAVYKHAEGGGKDETPADPCFDAVLCLGNTLPHIRQAEYDSFFASVSRLLGSGGLFIIQTLNYSHPSVKPGFAFPPISAGSSVFSRSYEAGTDSATLTFATDISIEGKHYRDKTTMYPVKPEALDEALERAGFGAIRRYAGWDLAAFDPNLDLYCITIAEKTL